MGNSEAETPGPAPTFTEMDPAGYSTELSMPILSVAVLNEEAPVGNDAELPMPILSVAVGNEAPVGDDAELSMPILSVAVGNEAPVGDDPENFPVAVGNEAPVGDDPENFPVAVGNEGTRDGENDSLIRLQVGGDVVPIRASDRQVRFGDICKERVFMTATQHKKLH